jgi:hypoxanthine phosphoribosyltransferase
MGQRFLYLSWGDVDRLVEAVAGKVVASGFAPNLVVAVSRGGFVPARILCDCLDVRRLASVQVELYDGMVKRPEPTIVYPVNADVAGLRVLVVDDVADSGASLMMVKGHVEALGAAVRVAALHVKPWSLFAPDYYAECVGSWVVYPWETREKLR